MKLSVTSWSFPACTLGEAWGIARALGFGHIDVGLLHGPSLDRTAVLADPVAAAAALNGQGIAVSNVYWLFGADPAERAVSDPASLTRNLDDLDKACRFAAELSAPTVFVLPGMLRPGAGKNELLAHAEDGLREMVAVAGRHGVTLTVEPHVGGLLDSPERTLALLEAVPGLRLALDYAHFVCMGFTQDRIDPLAGHAGHVHLRQARPGALQAKWGAGTIDFGAVFERLREVGYDGYLAVEYVHQGYMDTLFDDVLTETVKMRDLARAYGVS